MTQRLFFRVIAASLLVLLLMGTTGCGRTKSLPNLVTPSGQPDGVIFVSKQAPVMVSMLVNPDRLQARELNDELSKLKTSLFADTGINYQKDIQPWLGNEITLAVTSLDLDRDSDNGQQPGYLMILATEQPQESREFVELLFSQRALAGANLVTEEYKGVKLIYDIQQETPTEKKQGGYFSSKNRQSKSSFPGTSSSFPGTSSSFPGTSSSFPGRSLGTRGLAGTVVGNSFVLFANDPKVLRDAINNVEAPDLNLVSSSKYQQAAKQVPKEALAVAFFNLPRVAKWLGWESLTQTYDSQIISLVQQGKGLMAETAFHSKKETLVPSTQLSLSLEALQYIPAEAGLTVAGSNLSNLDNSNLALLWQQVLSVISGTKADVSGLLQPLTTVQQSWGINWKEDIFPWVQGEYAIGLLPREEKINPESPDWIFVTEKSEATSKAISHLNEIATDGGLSLSSLDINGQKIFAWTKLITATSKSPVGENQQYTIQAKVLGAYAAVGNYEIFASSIEAMDEALTAKDNSLVNSSDFQNSIVAIPQPNQGYMYLDWMKSQAIFERQLPLLKFVEVIGKPFFQKLRSIALSSYGSDTELLKGGVFFQFR